MGRADSRSWSMLGLLSCSVSAKIPRPVSSICPRSTTFIEPTARSIRPTNCRFAWPYGLGRHDDARRHRRPSPGWPAHPAGHLGGAARYLNGRGRADAAVWVMEDLTALHQAEAARQDTEGRLRTVVETMGEGLIVQDRNGVIVDSNTAACNILATPAERSCASSCRSGSWGGISLAKMGRQSTRSSCRLARCCARDGH